MFFDFDAPEVATYAVKIPQGIQVSRSFTLQEEDGTVRDTAGYSAIATFVAAYGTPSLLELSTNPKPDGTTGNGRITMGIQGTAPNQYNVKFLITKADSLPITYYGIGIWQMDIYDTFGRPYPRIEGPWVLGRKITP